MSHVQVNVLNAPNSAEETYEQRKQAHGLDMLTMHDDRSSSFPFPIPDSNTLYDQSSTGTAQEADGQPTATESIDNLLATLAEDNANSLPPVSDDNSVEASMNNDNAITGDHTQELSTGSCTENIYDVYTDSISCPAIAETIQNGSSQDTKFDGLDAEMVSEDELPTAHQPKVDDAEEVSDEELPGPKLAELPADTEVVSEDELPASSKVKRKAGENYDPSSPTDSAPEKRTKPNIGNRTSPLPHPLPLFFHNIRH